MPGKYCLERTAWNAPRRRRKLLLLWPGAQQLPLSPVTIKHCMTEWPQVDLVGVGLNATDTLIPLPAYPERGSKLEYYAASVMPGGQVATTVVACQQWGLRTRYVGKLGDDDAARLHEEAFQRAGVEAQLVKVHGGVSPQSLILVDAGGERTVMKEDCTRCGDAHNGVPCRPLQ